MVVIFDWAENVGNEGFLKYLWIVLDFGYVMIGWIDFFFLVFHSIFFFGLSLRGERFWLLCLMG